MLNLIEDQKRMFYTSGYTNNYILTFHDIGLVIDNETIHSETPVIKESICDVEDFTLGGCISSSMEFEVSEILADEITGLVYTAQIEVKNEDGEVALMVPMGVFRVDQSQLVDDKDYKKVTAYDRMYDISEDVAAWYNKYFSGDATHTVKETRESLLTYLGIPFVVQNLPNDDVTVEKTIESTSMSGTDVLRALCVINGGFGHMNREGKFEVIILTGHGLFPEGSLGENENVYPSETLYPEDYFEYLGMSDDENACPEYRSCKYEEYMTMPITCLNIQSTTDDIGVTVGDDLSNPYVITANFFLYGKSHDELTEIGQNILGNIKDVTYRPNTTELNGLPYLECGDVYALEKKNDSVESYIFSRTLSGIQALKDTYEAKGNYIRANEVSANDEIIQLKGKSLEIKKSVEGLSSEVKDFEKNTASKFEQTDESISAEVERATEAEGKLSSSIEQNAKEIVLKVDENGNIVEVALTADPEEGTKFTVTAKNIELSAEEVLDLLSGGTINMSGKNINIESDNFSVTESGEVSAKSIDISGGSINLVTDNQGDNLICLRNVSYDTGEYSVSYYGNGDPYDIADVETEECYLDLDTGAVWEYRTDQSGVVKRWMHVYTCEDYRTARYEECTLNTSDGVSASIYQLKVLTDVSSGVEKEITVKDGTTASIDGDGLHLHKDIYSAPMGNLKEEEIDAYISLSEYYDESNNAQPEIVSDAPMSVPKITAGNMVSGSVVKYLTKGTRYYVSVSLDMESTPNVIVTPETTNPSEVSVSVANVSNTGFDIYMHRTDTDGNLMVYWTAMC